MEITIRFGVNAEVRMDATLEIYGEPYSFVDGYEFEDITDFKEVISKFGETLKTQGELFLREGGISYLTSFQYAIYI